MLNVVPAQSVNNRLKNNHTPHPSMKQVVGVETDLKKSNQWIVASCEDDERNHVDDGHDTCSTSQLSDNLVVIAFGVVKVSTVGEVGCEV